MVGRPREGRFLRHPPVPAQPRWTHDSNAALHLPGRPRRGLDPAGRRQPARSGASSRYRPATDAAAAEAYRPRRQLRRSDWHAGVSVGPTALVERNRNGRVGGLPAGRRRQDYLEAEGRAERGPRLETSAGTRSDPALFGGQRSRAEAGPERADNSVMAAKSSSPVPMHGELSAVPRGREGVVDSNCRLWGPKVSPSCRRT